MNQTAHQNEDTTLSTPIYQEIMWPTLKSLEKMGGSASISELEDKVSEYMNLSDDVLDAPHTSGSLSSFSYRAGWARTHLKYFGAVENSQRGVWSITETGRNISSEEQVLELNKKTRKDFYEKRKLRKNESIEEKIEDQEDFNDEGWEDYLLSVMKEMDPSAFERLCQRLLREAGFSKVEVTGKSGDGGIDGVGVLKVNLLSFHVRFQCKRYAEAVSSGDIRNFRGAMQGRADKGLFITTGRYTKSAEEEAVRDGAPAIDLINGIELCALLKKYSLGVKIENIEQVQVQEEFFQKI